MAQPSTAGGPAHTETWCVPPSIRSRTRRSPSAVTVSSSTPWNWSVMPSRSPTICSVAPAQRDADSHPPNTSSRERSSPGMAAMASASAAALPAASVNPPGRAVEGHQLERHLLRQRHHHLLQLGLRRHAHQPHLAAGRLLARCAASYSACAAHGIEHVGQHRLVPQARAPAGPSTGSRVWSGSGTMLPQTTMWNGDMVDSDERRPPACSDQFSVECRPPVPARNSRFVRSGSPGSGCVQFQRQAPQWTHFSRSKAGTPPSVGRDGLARAHLDAELGAAVAAQRGIEEDDVVGVAGRRLHLAADQQRVLVRHEQLAVVGRWPASRTRSISASCSRRRWLRTLA